MLVLSRKKEESIIINDNIVIKIVDVRGDKVRIGIEAPKNVTIDREEVYEKKYNLLEIEDKIRKDNKEIEEKIKEYTEDELPTNHPNNLGFFKK